MRSFSAMAAGNQKTATLVGVFIFTGIAVLAWLLLQVGNFQNNYENVNNIEVRFKDASGLIVGSPVRLAGVRIGSVSGPPVLETVNPPRILLPLAIDASREIPSNAIFRVQSASVLGDKLVSVTIPDEPSHILLADKSVLEGGGASGLEALQNDAVAIVDDVHLMMEDAQASLQKFGGALDDVRVLTRQLSVTIEQVNTGLLSDQNLGSISRTLSNVEDASLGARNASADLKPLMVDARKAINQVTQLAEKAEGTFENVDTQLATIGPAVEEVPETLLSLQRVANKAEGAVGEAEKTLAKAGQTLDTLNSDDGLVGTLTKDEEVNSDTKTFIKNLRRHGILGYKDEETPENDPRERFRGRRR